MKFLAFLFTSLFRPRRLRPTNQLTNKLMRPLERDVARAAHGLIPLLNLLRNSRRDAAADFSYPVTARSTLVAWTRSHPADGSYLYMLVTPHHHRSVIRSW